MLSDTARVAASSASLDRPKKAAIPWLQGRDGFVVCLALLLWLIGLVLPEGKWLPCARWLARRRLAFSAKLSGDELETIKVVVGHGEDKAAWIERAFRREWLAHKYLSWTQLLACYPPRRWRPRVTLIGRQHLDDALARGNGAVLFTANFVHKDLMTKVALAEAGYRASHLVRDSHGFAESRLGRRLLNPIYAGIERRFLRKRLVFSGNKTDEVNAMIRSRLRDNQPILVTVTPLGRRTNSMPFLHGRIKIATGALKFACEAGATVLPVFTIRKPNGGVETIIEHPLERPRKAAHSEAIEAMLDDYVPRLETYVAQYPEQFAFPTSDRFGQALIEPRTADMRSQAKPESASGQAVPELTS